MDIDFDKLLGGDDEAPTNPRDIFLTLDKAPGFSFLRDVQSDVLDAWFDDRDRRDSVIKLNVGSGKTLVGLLILQSCLNEGHGPAVYGIDLPRDACRILAIVGLHQTLLVDVVVLAHDQPDLSRLQRKPGLPRGLVRRPHLRLIVIPHCAIALLDEKTVAALVHAHDAFAPERKRHPRQHRAQPQSGGVGDGAKPRGSEAHRGPQE